MLRDSKKETLDRARQNEQLKFALNTVCRDKRLLDRLTLDYTAMYMVDLRAETMEVLKLSTESAAADLFSGVGAILDVAVAARRYAEANVAPETMDTFLAWLKCAAFPRSAASRAARVVPRTRRKPSSSRAWRTTFARP